MQEYVERLLAALIILALLVLLIIMAWPVTDGKKTTASASSSSATRSKVSRKSTRAKSTSRRKRSRQMAMRDDGACGSGWEDDCDREPSPPPRYDNYGYEIRREPCRNGNGSCYCEDSWRPYWAWPRQRCR